MINEESIKRINELFKKQKTTGLTEEEKKEQKKLRQQYLTGIRSSLRSHLDNIRVVNDHDEQGR